MVDWTDAAEDFALIYALSLYSSVCGLKFENVGSTQDADIVWWKVNFGESIAGVHESVGSTQTSQLWGYFNPYAQASWSHLTIGGDGLNTVIHEIGHGMGLAHPHDGGGQPDKSIFPGVTANDDPGNYGYNQSVFTVMSYVPGSSTAPHDLQYGGQAGLGAFDIAALQTLYGVNTATGAGDNVYKLPTLEGGGLNFDWIPQLWNFGGQGLGAGYGWVCIWDAGGNDVINGSAASSPITIDLRPASLVYGDPVAGGGISQQDGLPGGFTIARGVIIESAIGSGGDVLVGNDADNRLYGNGGGDVPTGGYGNDILYGGEGADGFLFKTKPNKFTNIDVLPDFTPRQDKIMLDHSIFKKLGKQGKLKKDFFKLSAKSKDKNDYVFYDKKSGKIFYDGDGTGKKEKPVEFAMIKKGLPLRASDFLVY